MKFSKKEIFSRGHKIPEIKFEDQRLTSYSGLIIFQSFFTKTGIKDSLRDCFKHLKVREIFEHHIIMMLVIAHLLLGYRRLRDMEYYQDDPLVKRLLGLRRLPDVSTVSRWMRCADEEGIRKTREYNRSRIINGLERVLLYRITLDFDGSVLRTNGRKTEGTAVGYNKKKKEAMSYYPLFCTIAQTGQVFDVYHRPGNVHDSKAAREFILECIAIIKKELPWAKIEVRMDSAFFSDETVTALNEQSIEYTISVPLWKFQELGTIGQRLIQRAGRVTHPEGKLTLTMSGNEAVKKDLLSFLDGLKKAA